jgi:hypothetical protein
MKPNASLAPDAHFAPLRDSRICPGGSVRAVPATESACPGWRSAEDTARAATREALADWLETQSRVLAFYMERVALEDADPALIHDLDAHRTWLQATSRRIA